MNERILPSQLKWDSTIWKRFLESLAANSARFTGDLGQPCRGRDQ